MELIEPTYKDTDGKSLIDKIADRAGQGNRENGA